MNMRKQLRYSASGEEGFVLALSLCIMGVLVIIGAAAIQTAMFELDIAGSDARQRIAFYSADAGADVASEVLEQELACKGELVTGFNQNAPDGSGALVGDFGVYVADTANPLWMQEGGEDQVPEIVGVDSTHPVGTGPVDIVYPYGRNTDESVTIMSVNGQTAPLWGGALQMGAGYMGKGRGAASGGSQKSFYIYSQHLGAAGTNTNSTVLVQWRHVVGSGGGCVYNSQWVTAFDTSTITEPL